jgi:carbon monoxide dehydrogenase subunit G
MNNWAPLVPGYIEHKIIDKKRSTWKFKGEAGMIQKTVHLQVDITDWQEPSKVSFDLTGFNENVKGGGSFEASALEKNKTDITGRIDIAAKGMIAPMINTVLKSLVPKTTKELTEAVARKMQEKTPVPAT